MIIACHGRLPTPLTRPFYTYIQGGFAALIWCLTVVYETHQAGVRGRKSPRHPLRE